MGKYYEYYYSYYISKYAESFGSEKIDVLEDLAAKYAEMKVREGSLKYMLERDTKELNRQEKLRNES